MNRLTSVATGLGLFLITASGASASTYTFCAGVGCSTENATVTINQVGSILEIYATNNLANPATVVGAISQIYLNYTAAPTAASFDASQPNQNTVTVAGNGSFTTGTAANAWTVGTTSNTVLLDSLVAQPDQTILGPPGGPTYSAANNSIAGNGPHNPFINQTGVFYLDITDRGSLSSVVLNFGTVSGADEITGVLTPIPPALALFGGGCLGLLAFFGWHRRRRDFALGALA
jgi:hypothetical protein